VKVEDPEVQVIVKEKHGRKGLLVSITCPTEKAQLFYTFNGIQPNHNSFKYNVTGPFVVTENTTLKVIAMVRQNGLESNIVTKELKVCFTSLLFLSFFLFFFFANLNCLKID